MLHLHMNIVTTDNRPDALLEPILVQYHISIPPEYVRKPKVF